MGDDRVAATLCSGTARAARAFTVAFVATVLAFACHVAAGGAPPPAVIIALVLVAAAPLCYWLSDRAWSARQLAAVFLLVQGGMHLVSMLTSGDSMHATLPMLGWHIAGTAATVAIARHGETCLWATVDALGLRAVRVPRLPLIPAWCAPWQPVWPTRENRTHQTELDTTPARGPPR